MFSSRHSGLSRPKMRNSQKSEGSSDMQYFKEVLTKVGITLQYTDNPNRYLKESSILPRDIQQVLQKHENFPNNIPEFMNGLKYLCSKSSKKEKYFKKALAPSMYDPEKTSLISKQQDCLIRVLLNVDSLQSEVINFLLEEVVDHVVEESEEHTEWLRLLLNPLRFLSYIQDSKLLHDKMIELLEIGTFTAQLEILLLLPVIIRESEHDDTAERLVRLMETAPKLTAAVIGCLNCFEISQDLKEKIQDRILSIMSTTTSLKTFPLILGFLASGCRPKNLIKILSRTRTAIDAVMTSESNESDRETHQLLTFQELCKLSCSWSGLVAEGWITVLSSVRTAEEHCPFDIFTMLMLHLVQRTHRLAVEALFKKKTKSGLITPKLVQNTFDKYLVPQIYSDYLPSMIALASSLVQGQSQFVDPLYVEMSRTIYKSAFCYKLADVPSRMNILESLIMWVSTEASSALGTLLALAATPEHLKLLEPHTLQLMTLLDKLEIITLTETAQLFKFLGALLWPPRQKSGTPLESNSSQSYILTIVRKQLSCPKQCFCFKGIVSAVAIIKNMATVSNALDESVTDVSYNSISELPVGRVQDAANLLKLVDQRTTHWPSARALYLDQLAQAVASTDNLDLHFMAWLVDNMTVDFQEFCVVNELPEKMLDFNFTTVYNLNEKETLNDNIIINIGGLTINTNTETTLKVVTLAPMFRVLRLLHQKHHSGSLSLIDALLGSGIVSPEMTNYTEDEDLEMCAHSDLRFVVNYTFHCINWFRELINAFVTQKDQSLRKKVLIRIKNVIELEDMLKKLMKYLPNHTFPAVHYYNASVNMKSITTQNDGPTKAKPKQSKKLNETHDTSKISTQGGSQTTLVKSSKAGIKEKETAMISYREMDTDIIVLLKYPVVCDQENLEESEINLDLLQFKFIMNDIISKLQKITKRNAELSHFTQTVKAEDFINDLVHLMPFIDGHLTNITKSLQELLEKCDGIYDSHEMFLPEANNFKIALGLILETIALIFSWKGFQKSSNLNLLRECLRALIEGDTKSTQMQSAQQLALKFITRLSTISDVCLFLPSAVSLVNIIKALCGVVINEIPIRKKLILLSGKLMERKWYNCNGMPETGAVASVNISTLVRAHLSGCDLKTINNIVSCIHDEVSQLNSKEDNLSTFQCITTANFPIMYRGICSGLHEALRAELNKGKTNSEHLDIWRSTATTLHAIMDIVKLHGNRSNLNSFLKKSTAILKLFLSHALPIFEIVLRTNSEKVIEILKIMQQSTRFLHNLCCHTKVTKDRSLVGLVPQMRLTLETLVFRVKALLAANNCSSVFWMGNLKNKDLQGEEIVSQTTDNSDGAIQDNLPADDEELPPDSESDDNADESKETGSASEIF